VLFEETFSSCGVDHSIIEKVKVFILATKIHSAAESNFCDSDLELFLDMDMSILGSPIDRYDSYCQQIRNEYKHFPDDQFYSGRLQFLETCLKKEKYVFNTEIFRSNLEAIARSNLARESKQITQKLNTILSAQNAERI
jgi:predicted metal-dependent HD superfamily phosphohydrolase